MFIDLDGTVRLCCNDWNRKVGYGKNIVDAWNKLDRIYNCSVDGTQKGKDEFLKRINHK